MNFKNTHVIITEWKKRAFDNKWMLFGKIYDNENKYSYKDDSGKIRYITYTKWIVLDVAEQKYKVA